MMEMGDRNSASSDMMTTTPIMREFTFVLAVKIVWEKSDPVAIKEIAIVLATENINDNLEWLENSRHFSIIDSPKYWMNLVFNIHDSKMY